MDINRVDFGAAFLPANQDPTLAASTTPGAAAVVADLMRAFQGYSSITQTSGWQERTYHSLQLSLQRRFRNGLSFGFNDTIGLYDRQNTTPRLQHDADGTVLDPGGSGRGRQAARRQQPAGAHHQGELRVGPARPARRIVGAEDHRRDRQRLAARGHLDGGDRQRVRDRLQLQQRRRQREHDRLARLRRPHPHRRRHRQRLQQRPYRQFNAAAFQGPLPGSVGLESGNNYLKGCFQSALDLSLQRNINLGGGRVIQLRADVFNAFNEARITGRNTTISFRNPSDPVTATNLPYDANGNLVASRSLPRGAGFGVANAYQTPRQVQLQIRFRF